MTLWHIRTVQAEQQGHNISAGRDVNSQIYTLAIYSHRPNPNFQSERQVRRALKLYECGIKEKI
jgi:hypothetical protein